MYFSFSSSTPTLPRNLFFFSYSAYFVHDANMTLQHHVLFPRPLVRQRASRCGQNHVCRHQVMHSRFCFSAWDPRLLHRVNDRVDWYSGGWDRHIRRHVHERGGPAGGWRQVHMSRARLLLLQRLRQVGRTQSGPRYVAKFLKTHWIHTGRNVLFYILSDDIYIRYSISKIFYLFCPQIFIFSEPRRWRRVCGHGGG